MPKTCSICNEIAASFNGAATCSLRNTTQTKYDEVKYDLLQWGRNLFVAEWEPACVPVDGV